MRREDGYRTASGSERIESFSCAANGMQKIKGTGCCALFPCLKLSPLLFLKRAFQSRQGAIELIYLHITRALFADQFFQHQLALQIHFEILFSGQTILFGRAVLRHHDDRGLQGRRHRKHQV